MNQCLAPILGSTVLHLPSYGSRTNGHFAEKNETGPYKAPKAPPRPHRQTTQATLKTAGVRACKSRTTKRPRKASILRDVFGLVKGVCLGRSSGYCRAVEPRKELWCFKGSVASHKGQRINPARVRHKQNSQMNLPSNMRRWLPLPLNHYFQGKRGLCPIYSGFIVASCH